MARLTDEQLAEAEAMVAAGKLWSVAVTPSGDHYRSDDHYPAVLSEVRTLRAEVARLTALLPSDEERVDITSFRDWCEQTARISEALDRHWRPFEPSRDEVQRLAREAKANTCNLHDDCAAADAAVAGHWRTVAGERIVRALHCSIDDCEDCFGC